MKITIEKTSGQTNRIEKMEVTVGYHTNHGLLIKTFETMLEAFYKSND